jgi:hypothetical protein
MVETLLDNEKQLLFSIKKASTLPNVTKVISPSWYET